jgi:hypothetical protein
MDTSFEKSRVFYRVCKFSKSWNKHGERVRCSDDEKSFDVSPGDPRVYVGGVGVRVQFPI